MKYDFNKDFTGLDGIRLEKTDTMGKVLANHLTGTKSSRIKVLDALEIGQKLHNGDIVDLKTTEQGDLKFFIESEAQLPPLFTGQLLKLMAETKEEKQPSK